MKSNMTINVEFIAGTDIKSAVEEAKNKAEAWGVTYVCFDFNGINFSIGKNADVCDVLEKWNDRESARYGICAP